MMNKTPGQGNEPDTFQSDSILNRFFVSDS